MDPQRHSFDHAFALRGTPARQRILVVLTSRADHYEPCLPRLDELFAGVRIEYLVVRHNASERLSEKRVIYTDAPLMTPEGLGTAIVSTFGDYHLIILTLNSEMVRIARFRNLFSLFYDHRPVYVLNSLSI